jgi:thiol-disulfide isomerase/thioredoxin
MNVRFLRLGLLLCLAGLVVLSACSGGAKPTETAESPAPTEAPAATANTQAYLAPTVAPVVSSSGAYPIPTATVYNPYPAPVVSTPYNPYPEPSQNQATSPTTQPAGTVNTQMIATDPASVQLASGKVQLVEFFAFWDGASQAMAPIMLTLETAYGDRMNFIYLDIDDPANAKFKEQLGYQLQPQFYLLDERGNVVKQWKSSVDEAELRAAIEAALK